MAIKQGDGSALRPMRWWQLLHRTVFGIEHAAHRYVVDARLLDDEARLYVDGVQTARSSLPVRFAVDGGRIEVAASTYGLKRMHLVTETGTTQLVPAPRTAERWRAELGRRSPVLSAMIASVAVIVLVIGLVVALPELLEILTRIPPVAERIGTFTSPIELPAWLAMTITVAGVIAGIERALTLRNHWLLDFDTFWLG